MVLDEEQTPWSGCALVKLYLSTTRDHVCLKNFSLRMSASFHMIDQTSSQRTLSQRCPPFSPQLEPPQHTLLKKPLRIILSTHFLQPPYILLPITPNGILGLSRIIQVNPIPLQIHLQCHFIRLLPNLSCGGIDKDIIRSIAPLNSL